MTQQACYATSLVVVSLYDTLGPAAAEFIIKHAEIHTIFISGANFSKVQYDTMTLI
jgi:long-subunit acyl-CoA synthetase (AMP-forming)